MSGFFHRLASRAMGSVPVAEPIVPSVFAPVGWTGQMEMPVEQTEVASVRPGNAATEASSSLALPRPRPTESITREIFETRERDVNRVGEPLVGRSIEPVESQQHLPERRSLPEPPSSPAVRREVMVERAVDQPVPVRSRSFLGPTQAPAPAPMRGGRDETDHSDTSSALVVRISIGRIEVRAEMPARTGTPGPPQKQRSLGMSLDEYAKLRAEGKR